MLVIEIDVSLMKTIERYSLIRACELIQLGIVTQDTNYRFFRPDTSSCNPSPFVLHTCVSASSILYSYTRWNKHHINF